MTEDDIEKNLNRSGCSQKGSHAIPLQTWEEKTTYLAVTVDDDYHLVERKKTWCQAQLHCRKYYTDLIEDEEDRMAVNQRLNHTRHGDLFWIALRQSRILGFWIWRDRTVSNHNWKDDPIPGMPLSNNCGAIDKTDFKWRDENCLHKLPFLCEEEISFSQSHCCCRKATLHPELIVILIVTLSTTVSYDKFMSLLKIITPRIDCDVPKKMGMNASQMIQVVYMVNPMGLASLKVSGTPRVLMAYTVHVTISRME
ncbi:hypothetical protein INR49_026637 [Caranx melampygus]|nr:hypothetical protein INR49_026637 [Caranx melampygus]